MSSFAGSLKSLVSLDTLLPRLSSPATSVPSIRISIPIPSFLQPQQQNVDPRLEELGNQLAENPTETPFFHDNGILKAAPKKKVSHMKRRQRLYAPGKKQIKFNHNLNRCPACGHYKRSHFLCMNCVSQIKQLWKREDAKLKPEPYKEEFSNPLDEKVLYPGKTERDRERKLREKEYLVQRPKTLPVETKK
ncbi:unnamed protein product [Ambrosiozyma monospora]|uniref:Large ribosomal subunit protein bL32m n=1 Tax=Ambrosiozyma monospora TaxID=43982 RepID=A0A9W6Z245_AMBMO|nr:unnamed protein product [Ambrosiozyma monospora]